MSKEFSSNRPRLTVHARMISEIAKFLTGGLRAAVALLGSLKSITCPQVVEPQDFARTTWAKVLIPLNRHGGGYTSEQRALSPRRRDAEVRIGQARGQPP